jgi:hypothetical protein
VPSGSTFVSETQTAGPAFACTNPPIGGTGTITCTASTLASGASTSFTVVVHVNSAGSFSNTASVGSTTPDPNTANNTSNVNTAVSKHHGPRG